MVNSYNTTSTTTKDKRNVCGAGDLQTLRNSRVYGRLSVPKLFKIYTGSDKEKRAENEITTRNITVASRLSGRHLPATGRKPIPAQMAIKNITTHLVSIDPKKLAKTANKTTTKCNNSVKIKGTRKALTDVTNVETVRIQQLKDVRNSKTDIKKSDPVKSFHQPRIQLKNNTVSANVSSKKPFKLSKSIKPIGSQEKITMMPRKPSGVKKSVPQNTFKYKKDRNPTTTDPENDIIICKQLKQESDLEKNHFTSLCYSNVNTSVAVTKVKQNKRRSFTSSIVDDCVQSCEMVKHPSIDDKTNPLEVSVYVEDIYYYYRNMELQNPLPENHLEHQVALTSKMRSILIDWLIDVHDKFDLMHETLFLMVELLDRALSMIPVKKSDIQLVGLTALLLASKYEDFWHPKIKELLSIAPAAYSRTEFLAMEKVILLKLRYRLNMPTPYVFMLRFLKASQSDEKVEHLSYYLIELSLVHYEALKLKPSLLSASAVYVARSTLQVIPAWSELLKKHTNYVETDLRNAADMILQFQRGASNTRLKSTYNKFLSPNKSSVAAIKALERLP